MVLLLTYLHFITIEFEIFVQIRIDGKNEWEKYSYMYLFAYMYVRSCDSWPEKIYFHQAGVIECDLFNQTCSMEPILVRKILAIWILQWPFGPVRIDAHVMSTIVDYLQRNVSRGQQYVSNCIRASSWHPLGTRGAVAAARTTKEKLQKEMAWHGLHLASIFIF